MDDAEMESLSIGGNCLSTRLHSAGCWGSDVVAEQLPRSTASDTASDTAEAERRR